MINLELHALNVTCSAESRTISGDITVYEQLSESNGVVIHAGALEPRLPLSRVKLLRDHDHGDPVGFMATLDDASTRATFTVPEGENGDRALDEAQKGLRDGLSVGIGVREYTWDDDYNLHVYRAELYEVSLCAIPAFQDAQVTDVAASLATARQKENPMTRAQLEAALAAGTISQATFDTAVAKLPAEQLAAPAAPAAPALPAEFAAGPVVVEAAAPSVATADRPLDLRQAARRIVEAAKTRNVADVALALATIVPADDAGHGFIGRADWLGEIWQAQPEGRRWIDSFGQVKELTSTKIEGFIWETQPVPAKYAGNLAEVPTGPVKTKPISATPDRWAWAARLDRIFDDLGSDDLVQSVLALVTRNYQAVSDADVAAKVIAAATNNATAATSVLGAIAGQAKALRTIGANVDNIWLGEALFDEWAALKIADLPAWLANALGFVDLREGKSVVGDLVLQVDPKLAARQIVSYDKRAVTVYEKQPLTLEALVIPNGGIDIGWFSYGGILVNDARAIQKQLVTAP